MQKYPGETRQITKTFLSFRSTISNLACCRCECDSTLKYAHLSAAAAAQDDLCSQIAVKESMELT